MESLLFGGMGLEDSHEFAFESGDVDDFFFFDYDFIFYFFFFRRFLNGGFVFVIDTIFLFQQVFNVVDESLEID